METSTKSGYERALDSINRAYLAEDYDGYEDLIERTAARFCRKEWMVEDDATDQRLLGAGRN